MVVAVAGNKPKICIHDHVALWMYALHGCVHSSWIHTLGVLSVDLHTLQHALTSCFKSLARQTHKTISARLIFLNEG